MVDGEAGKGDTYRKVDPKKWAEGWNRAFNKTAKTTKDKKGKKKLPKR